MFEIYIENITTFTNPRDLWDFRVDRTSGSALGNPEYAPKTLTPIEREAAIERYRRWLWANIKDQKGAQFNELGYLARQNQRKEIVLLCWCHPLLCHASVVRSAIRWYQEKVK